MTPPALAQALLAAAAPASDYESIAGDLHEEHARIVSLHGAPAAHRWYWRQTLRSLPALLSYSRSNASLRRRIGVALISLAVLAAMLVVSTVIGVVLRGLFGVDRMPEYVSVFIVYAHTIAFGAILARLVRTDGVRVAFFASLFLVACFVIPALAGNPHSQAPADAWSVLCGAIPTMCLGAAFYQAATCRHLGEAA